MIDFEHIKKIDLDNNNGLSQIMGLAAQQHHDAFFVFYETLKIIRPSNILEIGTALGGFTEFLCLACKELKIDCKILSYDISDRPWYTDIEKQGATIKVENIFSNDYTEIEQEPIDFIKRDGITLVLCDGGNKIKEFNILSDYLKENDIIMAHDYAFNIEYFNSNIKNKRWNWQEIQYSDIQESCKRNNLVSFMKDKFDPIVWCCFVKEKSL
jgi:predicted O-methyltransferase YrrM